MIIKILVLNVYQVENCYLREENDATKFRKKF